MIHLEEFNIKDFDRMELKPGTWARREDRRMYEGYGKIGPAFTLFHDDLVIACGGICCAAWPGFGEAWLIPSAYIGKYPKSIFRYSRDFVEAVINRLDLFRVQTTVRELDNVSVRWIEHLGFTREGLLRKFTVNQENSFIYARIK